MHVYIPNFPIASSSFWVKVGSRDDPGDRIGMAHFFEHLLLTSTSKYPDRQKRLIEIEKRGFLFNAFTSIETSHYYYIHSNETATDALDFLVDGYDSSIFRKVEVDEEKRIILDEERRNREDPLAFMWRLANSGIWSGSRLGSMYYGDEKSLAGVGELELRDFYLKYYQPHNTTFVLINSIKNIEDQIDKIGSIKKTDNTKIVNNDGVGNKVDFVFDTRGIDHTVMSLSFITCEGSNYKDSLVLEFIKNYLGVGWISRLVTRLRIEEKLTYWIGSRGENLSDTGILSFTLSIDNDKVADVLKIFEEEIVCLKKEKIDGKKFDYYKHRFKAAMLRNCLDVGFLNWWYGSNLTSMGVMMPTIDQYLLDLENINVEDVLIVAKKYLNKNNFSVAMIAEKQPFYDVPTFQ